MSELKFLVPLSLAVVILNTTAIYVIVRTKAERRKSTTLILASLLVGDILIGAVLIPSRIIEIHLLKNAAFAYIYAYVLFVAVFNVAFLTWEKYVSITKPLWRRKIGNGTMMTIITINWTLPGLITLIPLCWEYSSDKKLLIAVYRYILVAIILSTIVAVVVFQGLILKGLYLFWKGKRGSRHQMLSSTSIHGNQPFRKKVKSFSLVIAVTMSTIVTWLPTIILNFRPDWSTPLMINLSLYSFFVNSLVDPILTLIFNFDFFLNSLRQKRVSKPMKRITTSNGGCQETIIDLAIFKNNENETEPSTRITTVQIH